MNDLTLDPRNLQAIQPDCLTTYLQVHGWQADRPFLDNAMLWTFPAASPEDAPEILVPLRHDLLDYLPRMREALQTLESVEHRPQREILHDLLSSESNLSHPNGVKSL